MTEKREWKDLSCIFKKMAIIIAHGDSPEVVESRSGLEYEKYVKCDGPKCAQFHPNFKGCSFRK